MQQVSTLPIPSSLSSIFNSEDNNSSSCPSFLPPLHLTLHPLLFLQLYYLLFPQLFLLLYLPVSSDTTLLLSTHKTAKIPWCGLMCTANVFPVTKEQILKIFTIYTICIVISFNFLILKELRKSVLGSGIPDPYTLCCSGNIIQGFQLVSGFNPCSLHMFIFSTIPSF